ncbi:Acetyltransferase (GNAT) family protein (plasmid) [Aquisphaera giovannonii]|uniref:Acetyltransferase (GNAT) family protein n=1 Tax=Aquisphaera giovannonii TaxID=406548 RepID=A0A5B9WGF8_9BACT|nr:GNAT family N-acetyltransferase [Aquisphaera giovannonii]QEH39264.1 Acetyltransferase (GNAT) family protein [Aquisphaera giovannonii]
MIRHALAGDTAALVAIGEATGIFRPHEAEGLLGATLDAIHAGQLGEGHQAHVWVEGPEVPPAGWVYFAPTPNANGVWDLWWIGTDPARQGRGIGSQLLGFVEDRARAAGGRLLLVETSSQPALDPTRRFYANRGYVECGRVPDFYGEGDAKVIFAKRLRPVARPGADDDPT